MMSTIIVTGGAGFIGSHVVDLLCASGAMVHVIDDLSTGKLSNLANAKKAYLNLAVHTLDIRSPDVSSLIASLLPDGIIHLAAQFSVKVSMRDPLFDASVNVLGLLNVLQGAVLCGCKKVVFASSGGTIYGDGLLPLTEEQGRHPTSFYGLTKAMAIDYLNLYRRHFNLRYVAIALGNVYGERQSPDGEAGVVSIFAARLLRGDACVINGDGHTTRDYVYVKDVARAFAQALTLGDGLINVASSQERTVLDVYNTLSQYAKPTCALRFTSALPGEVRRVQLAIIKAKTELNWEPVTSFEIGTAAVVEWLQQEWEQ